jgi:hypothetical protein
MRELNVRRDLIERHLQCVTQVTPHPEVEPVRWGPSQRLIIAGRVIYPRAS